MTSEPQDDGHDDVEGHELADRHLWQFAAVRDLFWIALGVFILWCGYQLRGVFTPVLIALTLAYFIDPLLHGLKHRFGVGRFWSSLAVVGIGVLVTAGLVWAGGALAVRQGVEMSDRVPTAIVSLADRFGIEIQTSDLMPSSLMKYVGEKATTDSRAVLDVAGKVVVVTGVVVDRVLYYSASLVLIPIYTFFFAWNYGALLDHAKHYIPQRQRSGLLKVLGKMDAAFGSFLRSRVAIGMIQSLLFSFAWYLADVPYWLLLGVATGILSMLPFLGFLGWPAAIMVKYLEGSMGTEGFDPMSVLLWPTVAYWAVQMVEIWVLTPLIQSQGLKLSPVTILIAAFAGGTAGGLYGVLLAVPGVAWLSIFFEEVLRPRLENWANDPSWDKAHPDRRRKKQE